jgi:hypothetical protein
LSILGMLSPQYDSRYSQYTYGHIRIAARGVIMRTIE